MGESLEHQEGKYYWFQKLTKKGYVCELEKKLTSSENKEDYMLVDVYGEKDDKIVCVEVITTSWTGKEPKDYLSSEKTLEFIKYYTSNKKPKSNKEKVTYALSFSSKRKSADIERVYNNTNVSRPDIVRIGLSFVIRYYNCYGNLPSDNSFRDIKKEIKKEITEEMEKKYAEEFSLFCDIITNDYINKMCNVIDKLIPLVNYSGFDEDDLKAIPSDLKGFFDNLKKVD